jgi:hypothetical protein
MVSGLLYLVNVEKGPVYRLEEPKLARIFLPISIKSLLCVVCASVRSWSAAHCVESQLAISAARTKLWTRHCCCPCSVCCGAPLESQQTDLTRKNLSIV